MPGSAARVRSLTWPRCGPMLRYSHPRTVYYVPTPHTWESRDYVTILFSVSIFQTENRKLLSFVFSVSNYQLRKQDFERKFWFQFTKSNMRNRKQTVTENRFRFSVSVLCFSACRSVSWILITLPRRAPPPPRCYHRPHIVFAAKTSESFSRGGYDEQIRSNR